MDAIRIKDLHGFIDSIKHIGALSEEKQKRISEIKEKLKTCRESCSEMMDEPYTEAFTAKGEEEDNCD